MVREEKNDYRLYMCAGFADQSIDVAELKEYFADQPL